MRYGNSGRRKELWGKILLLGMVALALILIISVIVRSLSDPNKVKNAQQRIAYLSELGWEVEAAGETEQLISLPKEFPDVLEDYNDLQRAQGFDLSRFAGKEVLLFTYTVKNYPGADTVEACLYVYKNHVIGGDIHSTGISGFMCGIRPGNTENS